MAAGAIARERTRIAWLDAHKRPAAQSDETINR
jgi:hypothetical protein